MLSERVVRLLGKCGNFLSEVILINIIINELMTSSKFKGLGFGFFEGEGVIRVWGCAMSVYGGGGLFSLSCFISD